MRGEQSVTGAVEACCPAESWALGRNPRVLVFPCCFQEPVDVQLSVGAERETSVKPGPSLDGEARCVAQWGPGQEAIEGGPWGLEAVANGEEGRGATGGGRSGEESGRRTEGSTRGGRGGAGQWCGGYRVGLWVRRVTG